MIIAELERKTVQACASAARAPLDWRGALGALRQASRARARAHTLNAQLFAHAKAAALRRRKSGCGSRLPPPVLSGHAASLTP
jgi:hypothetical protein